VAGKFLRRSVPVGGPGASVFAPGAADGVLPGIGHGVDQRLLVDANLGIRITLAHQQFAAL
jgi:hypothetical protein